METAFGRTTIDRDDAETEEASPTTLEEPHKKTGWPFMTRLRRYRPDVVQSPLETYLREINETALLTADQEKSLARLIGEGSTEARDQMVRANLRLVVNIARGSVIDTAALAAALREGRIAAAGLDVYESEPLPPTELLDLDNVVLTPHVAGWSPEAVQASVDRFMENARRHLAGEVPVTPV